MPSTHRARACIAGPAPAGQSGGICEAPNQCYPNGSPVFAGTCDQMHVDGGLPCDGYPPDEACCGHEGQVCCGNAGPTLCYNGGFCDSEFFCHCPAAGCIDGGVPDAPV